MLLSNYFFHSFSNEKNLNYIGSKDSNITICVIRVEYMAPTAADTLVDNFIKTTLSLF